MSNFEYHRDIVTKSCCFPENEEYSQFNSTFDEAFGDKPLKLYARRIKREKICDAFGNFLDAWYFSRFRSGGELLVHYSGVWHDAKCTIHPNIP